MITKEERADVKNELDDRNNTLRLTLAGKWLRQYEDTVTELEGRLELLGKILKEIFEGMEEVSLLLEKEFEECPIQSKINQIGESLVQQILSQLEKGDKDDGILEKA